MTTVPHIHSLMDEIQNGDITGAKEVIRRMTAIERRSVWNTLQSAKELTEQVMEESHTIKKMGPEQ